MKPESVLLAITNEIYTARTAMEAKTIMIEYLSGTDIRDRDNMINTVAKLTNLAKIQQYYTNCLLKFEGLSTK